MPNKETALSAIVQQGILPLFFHEDPELSLEIIKVLYKAGVRTLEYTNRGAAALENFTFLKSELKSFEDLHLGIGTIKTIEQANDFLKAGADYVVAPVVDPKVGNLVHEAGLLWIPGCFSPTEIHTAQLAQAALIKIFPANILGPAFVSSIKELFQGQLFIPTGGVEIEEENFRTWFKAGVCAVGMGSKLISKDVLTHRQFDKLHDLTSQALQLAKTCK